MGQTRLLPRPIVRPQAAEGATTARVLAFANQKGGVAKTTTTLNLGVAFREQGLRVLVVDLDPQGNLTMSQGLNPDLIERSMFDVLVHRIPIRDIIAEKEIDIAVSSIDLAGAELALSSMIGRERALQKALVSVQAHYDWILIDTPPSLGLLTINALVAASRVLIPAEARFFSIQGLQMIEESIEEVLYLNPKLRVLGILLSKLDRRLREEKQVTEYLRERWGARVFATEIGTNSKILEAASTGKTVFGYPGAERAVEGYVRLAEEVLRRG